MVFMAALLPLQALAISPFDEAAVGLDTPYYSTADTKSSDTCVGPGTAELDGHKLPAAKGGTGLEEAINEAGQVASTGGKVTFSKFATMGQKYRDYYMTMRWRYVKWNWNGTAVTGPEN